MPPAPNATLLASVPVKVNVLLAVNVLPSAIVKVEPVAGAVTVTLLTVPAVTLPLLALTSNVPTVRPFFTKKFEFAMFHSPLWRYGRGTTPSQ